MSEETSPLASPPSLTVKSRSATTYFHRGIVWYLRLPLGEPILFATPDCERSRYIPDESTLLLALQIAGGSLYDTYVPRHLLFVTCWSREVSVDFFWIVVYIHIKSRKYDPVIYIATHTSVESSLASRANIQPGVVPGKKKFEFLNSTQKEEVPKCRRYQATPF